MYTISTGTQPTEQVSPTVVEAMAEIGMAMTGHQPKFATPELVAASDHLITMGCGVKETRWRLGTGEYHAIYFVISSCGGD